VRAILPRVTKLAALRIPQRAAAIQIDRMREAFVEEARSRIQDDAGEHLMDFHLVLILSIKYYGIDCPVTLFGLIFSLLSLLAISLECLRRCQQQANAHLVRM
jgi:hypothetical protein